MKKLLTVLLLLTLSLSADINWQKDITTAFELAKKEHKNVMVFVEGEHCRWCKKLKHRTLSDASVEKRLESYISVRVMQENKEDMKDLPAIEGVPTIFFMTAEKKVLQPVVGYYSVDDFISFFNTIEEKTAKK